MVLQRHEKSINHDRRGDERPKSIVLSKCVAVFTSERVVIVQRVRALLRWRRGIKAPPHWVLVMYSTGFFSKVR